MKKVLFYFIVLCITALFVWYYPKIEYFEDYRDYTYEEVMKQLRSQIDVILKKKDQYKAWGTYTTEVSTIPIRVYILQQPMKLSTKRGDKVVKNIVTEHDVQKLFLKLNDVFHHNTLKWKVESTIEYIQVRNTASIEYNTTSFSVFDLLPRNEPYHPSILNIYFIPYLGHSNSTFIPSSIVRKKVPGLVYNTDEQIVSPPMIWIAPTPGREVDPTGENWDIFIELLEQILYASSHSSNPFQYASSNYTNMKGYVVSNSVNTLDISYNVSPNKLSIVDYASSYSFLP